MELVFICHRPKMVNDCRILGWAELVLSAKVPFNTGLVPMMECRNPALHTIVKWSTPC